MNVTTHVSRGNLEHITGLKKAVPVFGSLRDVTRGGQKQRHSSGDNNKKTEYITSMNFPSFSYV
jgi:hypothetical protein